MAKPNMSVASVVKLNAASVGKSERHNERKNTNYENVNVVPERIPFNVSFKSPGDMTYNEYFDHLVAEGKISTRGLKDGATYFNEMIIDVNTAYFEEHGGYEFAKEFYEEAYRFCCEIYGEDQIVSAVMHADEINSAVSEELGKPVYHYHLHVVAIPTVEKEILWSKRCKDESLRGTVKEVIRQVSHSKKWKNSPVLDEHGQPVLNSKGKPQYVKSYSILQDQLFEHMTAAGFTDFQRGERGSTAEHLESLDFQIKKDAERLAQGEEKIAAGEERLAEIEQATEAATAKLQKVQIRYDQDRKAYLTYGELEGLGKKGITGKYSLEPKDYRDLVAMAKEGVASRGEISRLNDTISRNQRRISSLSRSVSALEEKLAEMTAKYDKLVEMTRPYVEAVQRFPEVVKSFIEKLLPPKEHKQEQEIRKSNHRNRDGAR